MCAILRRSSSAQRKQVALLECRYYSALPTSNVDYYLERPDKTAPTDLAALVGQAYQAQPGSSEDKALYQVGNVQCHLAQLNAIWPSLTACAT